MPGGPSRGPDGVKGYPMGSSRGYERGSQQFARMQNSKARYMVRFVTEDESKKYKANLNMRCMQSAKNAG